jgi:transposase-like protein
MGKRWNVPYKKVVLEYAELCGRDVESYRSFGVARSTFYQWRKTFRENGAAGLIPEKPIALHHPRALPPGAVEKILELRKLYGLGPQRITQWLERDHGIFFSVIRAHIGSPDNSIFSIV